MVRIVGINTEKKRQPKGYSPRPGYKKIAVSFRTETFEKLLAEAKRDGISFSNAVERAVNSRLRVNQMKDVARSLGEKEQA